MINVVKVEECVVGNEGNKIAGLLEVCCTDCSKTFKTSKDNLKVDSSVYPNKSEVCPRCSKLREGNLDDNKRRDTLMMIMEIEEIESRPKHCINILYVENKIENTINIYVKTDSEITEVNKINLSQEFVYTQRLCYYESNELGTLSILKENIERTIDFRSDCKFRVIELGKKNNLLDEVLHYFDTKRDAKYYGVSRVL